MADLTVLTRTPIAEQHCICAKKAIVVQCLHYGYTISARREEDCGRDAWKEVMNVQDIGLERNDETRDLLKYRARIEGPRGRDGLIPNASDFVVVSRIQVNGVLASSQHSHFFCDNSVFSASLLIPIMGNQDLHDCLIEA